MKNLITKNLLFGAAFGFIGVALGAFGAHGLKNIVSPDLLVIFETGARYQMYHAFALLFTGLLQFHIQSKHLSMAGNFFIAGIFLFSGSLYAMTFTGIRTFGAITPFGGVSFLVGWFLLVLAVVKNKKDA